MANKTIPTCGSCQFFKQAHQDFGACICPFQPKHLERETNAACVYWTAQPAGPKGRVLDLHDGYDGSDKNPAQRLARVRLEVGDPAHPCWVSLQILDLDGETVVGEVLLEHYEGAVVTRVWDDMDGDPIHTTTHLITSTMPTPAPTLALVEA